MKPNSCLVCGSEKVDKCHIKSKGSGGTLDSWNIFFACRKHHREQHQIGVVAFMDKYDSVKKDFWSKGWRAVTEFGITKLRREKK